MRRKLIAAATLAAVTALVVSPTSGAAAAPRSVAATATLAWGACPPPLLEPDPRQECATLPVPLDYRSPQGRTIDLVVSRIATAKPGLRRGVLLVDLGGPGDVGVDAPSYLVPLMPPELLDRYDIVGFDPRGVRYSAGISCHYRTDVPSDLHERYPALDGSIDRNVAYARDLAQRCATFGGDVLPYVTTANTARDLDRVRAALGEQRISYLGYSYGTYLGAVYRTLFPHRADRFVLDSSDDPGRFGYGQFQLVSLGAALRLPDFTRWAGARDAVYHLGTTSAAVRRTFDELTARLDTEPLTLPDGTVVNGNLVRSVTFGALYRDSSFPGLAETLSALAGASAARLPASLGAARTAAVAELPADNLPSVQAAIHCNDGAWPRDVATYQRNVTVDRRLFPATAGFPANIWACAFWRVPDTEPAVRVHGNGTRGVLIVQNLRDPATPWIGALGMQRALGSDAVLLSVDQGGHTAYLTTASGCANDTTTAFLVRGVLPAGPRLCPGQPLPA